MEVQKALLLWVEPPDLRRATPELALTASRLDECVALGGRQRAVLKLTELMALPVVAFTLLDGRDEKTAGIARSVRRPGTITKRSKALSRTARRRTRCGGGRDEKDEGSLRSAASSVKGGFTPLNPPGPRLWSKTRRGRPRPILRVY
jgi:hypothetical protein